MGERPHPPPVVVVLHLVRVHARNLVFGVHPCPAENIQQRTCM